VIVGEVLRGERDLLIPNYLKGFRCLGPECEDSCCRANWEVPVDHRTYKKFKNECRRRGTEAEHFHGKFRRNRSSDNPEEDYARLVFRDGGCQLQLPDGFCLIQKDYGEAFLPNVCACFPRLIANIGGTIEAAASLACPPLAARLVEMKNEPLSLVKLPAKDFGRVWAMNTYRAAGFPENDIRRYLVQIRNHLVSVLQHPDHSIEEKLILIGLALQNLDAVNGQPDSPERLAELLGRYRRLLGSSAIKEEIARIRSNPGLQLQLIKEFADKRVLDGTAEPQFLGLFLETMMGLGFVPGNPPENILEKYVAGAAEKGEDVHRYDYLFESFLVNHLLGKNLLDNFASSARLFDGFLSLVINFCFLRFLLIGALAFRGSLEDQSVAKTVRLFTKTVEHSPGYLTRIRELVRTKSMDTMAYMSILIKL
jgi:lysine-N-methylase